MSAIEQAPMVGAAAGAKSYSARSGGIFGMLSEMRDESERNLAADQRAELEAATPRPSPEIRRSRLASPLRACCAHGHLLLVALGRAYPGASSGRFYRGSVREVEQHGPRSEDGARPTC